MPTPDQIAGALARAANEFRTLALAWHLLLAMGLVAIIAGWRPSRRTAALLIALPCWSVAALAWYYGNPFNGLMFTGLAITLMSVATRLTPGNVNDGSTLDRAAGVALIAFGFVYPHFLEAGSVLAYAYESPLGLIPCPTLSAIAGLSLLANGFESRAWLWCLAVVAAFYGLLGVAVLAVRIDLVLVAGGAALAAAALRQPWRIPEKVGDFSQAR